MYIAIEKNKKGYIYKSPSMNIPIAVEKTIQDAQKQVNILNARECEYIGFNKKVFPTRQGAKEFQRACTLKNIITDLLYSKNEYIVFYKVNKGF